MPRRSKYAEPDKTKTDIDFPYERMAMNVRPLSVPNPKMAMKAKPLSTSMKAASREHGWTQADKTRVNRRKKFTVINPRDAMKKMSSLDY